MSRRISSGRNGTPLCLSPSVVDIKNGSGMFVCLVSLILKSPVSLFFFTSPSRFAFISTTHTTTLQTTLHTLLLPQPFQSTGSTTEAKGKVFSAVMGIHFPVDVHHAQFFLGAPRGLGY